MKKIIVLLAAAVLIALCFFGFRIDTIKDPTTIEIETQDGNLWRMENNQILFYTCFTSDKTDDFIISVF